MEAQIKIISQTLPSVEWNFEEVKSQLIGGLETYKNYIVTEESLPEDKKELANLRALSKRIDEARKSFEKEITVPVNEFKNQVKELLNLVDEVVKPIAVAVDQFEIKAKQDRLEKITAIRTELLETSGLDEHHTRLVVFDEKLSNVGVSIKSIRSAIAESIEAAQLTQNRLYENRETLKGLLKNTSNGLGLSLEIPESRIAYILERNVIDMAWATTEIVKICQVALNYEQQLELAKKAAEERELKEAKLKEEEAARRKVVFEAIEEGLKEEPSKAKEIEETKTTVQGGEKQTETEEPKLSFILELTGPRSKMVELRKLIDSLGITYQKIDPSQVIRKDEE